MMPAEARVFHPAATTIAARPEADLKSRSPLAQMLHALNQPLTGLQCSMEVALATPRSNEQYVRGLREGLELTERMRALVEAIREVADGADDAQHNREAPETLELKAVLGAVVDELAPVAEAKSVSLVVIGSSAARLTVSAGRRPLTGLLFRLLDSTLSLAAQGTLMKIETGWVRDGVEPGGVLISIRWQEEHHMAGPQVESFSRPELGLLVAQAGCESSGGRWDRARNGGLESVSIRLPGDAPGKAKF
jgi:signal transduction histidine kinase